MSDPQNRLWFGDNLGIMQRMPAASVDLIYLDPPFKSDRNYNLLYRNLTGRPVPEQADAFCDTWELDPEKEHVARTMPVLMREKGIQDAYVEFWRLWMDALRHTQPKLMAYLVYMVQRLLHMRPLLRPHGSIYLHCDPTASHYIKVMMDAIFGHDNFLSEIVWKRTSAHSKANRPGPVHDVLLMYRKSEKYVWNPIYQAYDQSYVDEFYAHEDADGRRWMRADLTGAGTRDGETGGSWRGIDITAKGRHWAWPPAELDRLDSDGKIHWPARKGGMPRLKKYLEEQSGVPLQDVWTDIRPIHNLSSERLGYQTQKPRALVERIIRSSSNPGAVVFDPFCGCGTTVYAAHSTGRRWIGIDRAMLAVNLIQAVLEKRHGLNAGTHYDVRGIPESVEQAEALAKQDPHEFQSWIIERVRGFPVTKKGADRGIDGRIYFETGDTLASMILSVKSGHVRPTDIRELRGVVDREADAIMGGFLSLREPSHAMRTEAASAGMFEYAGLQYPKIQMLTAAQVLERAGDFKTPTKMGTRVTGQMVLGGMDLIMADR